jgi:hypothetical protein
VKNPVLYMDQYGESVWARTVKELRSKVPGRIEKMYVDRSGQTFHTGYVIGGRWLMAFAPIEKKA